MKVTGARLPALPTPTPLTIGLGLEASASHNDRTPPRRLVGLDPASGNPLPRLLLARALLALALLLLLLLLGLLRGLGVHGRDRAHGIAQPAEDARLAED